MSVGQRDVDMRAVPRRDHLREPRRGAAGQREGGSAGGGVDDADVLHEDAAFEAGADGLGEGLLGGEALGIGAGAGEGTACRLGALDLGEDAFFEALAEAVERGLNTLDIDRKRTRLNSSHECAPRMPSSDCKTK